MTMHVYSFEEGEDFIAARNVDEAKAEYRLLRSGELCKELTEQELNELRVEVLDEYDVPTGETITMRHHLRDQLVDDKDEPAFYLCGKE